MNTVVLKGNLTADPEARTLQNTKNGDVMVCNFQIAVNEKYRSKGSTNTVETTTFIPCEAWGNSARFISEYVRRGDPVLLSGSLKLDTWETSDGSKRSRLKVKVYRIEKLNRRQSQPNNPSADSPPQTDNVDTNTVEPEFDPVDNEVPF